MNELLLLAISAVSLITSLVRGVVEGFGEGIGQKVYDLIKEAFSKDVHATNVIKKFTNDPDRYKDELIELIMEKADRDKNFAEKLRITIEGSYTGRDKSTSITTKGDYTAVTVGNHSSASVRVESKESRNRNEIEISDNIIDSKESSKKKRR